MKNQSGTIKTYLELDRVVMGGSGGYRRLPGGSDHFSLQTHRQTDTHHNVYIIMIVINAVIIPTLRERKPQWFWRANILRPGCRAHVSMLSWVQVDKIQCNFNFNLHFLATFFWEFNKNYFFRRERGKGFDNAKCFFMNGTASWYQSPELITNI